MILNENEKDDKNDVEPQQGNVGSDDESGSVSGDELGSGDESGSEDELGSGDEIQPLQPNDNLELSASKDIGDYTGTIAPATPVSLPASTGSIASTEFGSPAPLSEDAQDQKVKTSELGGGKKIKKSRKPRQTKHRKYKKQGHFISSK